MKTVKLLYTSESGEVVTIERAGARSVGYDYMAQPNPSKDAVPGSIVTYLPVPLFKVWVDKWTIIIPASRLVSFELSS